MRKLVITQNITVDGSVEMLDDWFDPQSQDDDLLAESHRQDAQADALLVGRRTFEDFRAYWPNQTDDATGVTDYLKSREGRSMLNSIARGVFGSPYVVVDGELPCRPHVSRCELYAR